MLCDLCGWLKSIHYLQKISKKLRAVHCFSLLNFVGNQRNTNVSLESYSVFPSILRWKFSPISPLLPSHRAPTPLSDHHQPSHSFTWLDMFSLWTTSPLILFTPSEWNVGVLWVWAMPISLWENDAVITDLNISAYFLPLSTLFTFTLSPAQNKSKNSTLQWLFDSHNSQCKTSCQMYPPVSVVQSKCQYSS